MQTNNTGKLIDIDSWMDNYAKQISAHFGDRIVFIGLQGSYGREEATEQSDIDVVVILDELRGDDLSQYRKLLDNLPYREKICGFISGRAELQHWEPGDLFSFYNDTRSWFGSLDFIRDRIDAEGACKAVLSEACTIFHAACHNMLYSHSDEIGLLLSLYKSTFFIIRAKYYYETGQYISKKVDLIPLLQKDDRTILELIDDVDAICKNQATEDVQEAKDRFSNILVHWARELIVRFGKEHNKFQMNRILSMEEVNE